MNGALKFYFKTAIANALVFRDNVKGQDIITVDTDADEIALEYHTIITNLVTQIDFTDSPYLATWGQDIEVDATAGNVIVNLPTAVGSNGKRVVVTKIDSSINTITTDADGTETINGSLTDVTSSQWTSNRYKSNNTNITKR